MKVAREHHGDYGEEIAALIVFTAYTGVRPGELAALRWSDLDIPNRRATISRALDGQGGIKPLGTVTVSATLNSAPNTTFVINWYFSADQQCANNQQLSRPLAFGSSDLGVILAPALGLEDVFVPLGQVADDGPHLLEDVGHLVLRRMPAVAHLGPPS